MGVSRDELLKRIEEAREVLNKSIEAKTSYDKIYQYSVELDQLIELYITSGF